MGVAYANDGSGRLFVFEKSGIIRIVEGGQIREEAFLDIRGRVGSNHPEQGLLGMAFHPRYPQERSFFVIYTNKGGETIVSRFGVSADSEYRANLGGERIFLTEPQPTLGSNGGGLAFGQDGYLYIGLGDGGGVGDQYNKAQDDAAISGSILRIDIDQGSSYEIPEDNPFVDDQESRGEVWAKGLRNPWRLSFDKVTGDMYFGDVGEGGFQEINFQPDRVGGQNYGWPKSSVERCIAGSTTWTCTGSTSTGILAAAKSGVCKRPVPERGRANAWQPGSSVQPDSPQARMMTSIWQTPVETSTD
jgi:glucose/arabinose dehydrogenase